MNTTTAVRTLKIPTWLPPLVIGGGIWILPHPVGIDPKGWHLLALFIAVITGIITKPMPMGAVAFLGMTVTALSGTLPLSDILGTFSHPVVWLVFLAFFIAKGLFSSGLALRMAYQLVYLLGRRTLGLSYGLILADLSLAPAIPSDTARAGGILFPVIKGLSEAFGSAPKHPSSGRMGTFLTLCAYQGAVVTSALFLTAMATNPLIAQFTLGMGYPLSWAKWTLYALTPGVCSLSLIPLVIYWLSPPEIKVTPNAAPLAKEELKKMGRVSSKEWTTLGTFLLLIFLWITGPQLGIHPCTAAMAGIALLLLSGVLSWEDLISEKRAWETLIWFSVLIMMATHLQTLGVIGWFGDLIAGHMVGYSWQVAFPALALIYFFSHYFFAGNTSHVAALFLPFSLIAIHLGTPPMLAILILSFFSCLFSGLTHYGTAAAPLLYGGGYVDIRTWWKVGLACAILNILIWGGIGTLWWHFLGVF